VISCTDGAFIWFLDWFYGDATFVLFLEFDWERDV